MEQQKPQIRDMRNGDWLWINKLVLESPYLTNGAKVIYSALAYFANNDNQKAYPSIQKLSQLSSLNRSTVISSIKQLEEFYFIEIEKKKGKISQYTLLRLTDSQPVGKSNQLEKGANQSEIGNGVVENRDTNNTNTILNTNTMPAKPAGWDLNQKLDEYLNDKRRDLQIIALWIQEMKLNPQNEDQWQTMIRRRLRPAKLLEGYTNDDIIDTIRVMRNTDYLKKIEMETCLKYIEQVVASQKKEGPKIVGFTEEVRDGRKVMVALYHKEIKD